MTPIPRHRTPRLSATAFTGALELDNGHRYRWDGGMARSLSAFNDHDGTLLIEQAIDWLISNRPGTIVAQSTNSG